MIATRVRPRVLLCLLGIAGVATAAPAQGEDDQTMQSSLAARLAHEVTSAERALESLAGKAAADGAVLRLACLNRRLAAAQAAVSSARRALRDLPLGAKNPAFLLRTLVRLEALAAGAREQLLLAPACIGIEEARTMLEVSLPTTAQAPSLRELDAASAHENPVTALRPPPASPY